MEVQEALSKGIKILNENNIEEAAIQTRILLASILVCRKEELIIKSKEKLNKESEERFFKGIEKISKGYPVQYLTNTKEFMGIDFYVDENVLVPRSDTEILVEETISIAKEHNKREILELCTGSGAIAISIAKYIENANITATDISGKALDVARKNEGLGTVPKPSLLDGFGTVPNPSFIKFIQSDMFENVEGKFDIIVSNPPYIKTGVIKEYNLKFEPKLALDGGKDGLKFYRIIIEQGHKYLKTDGYILLEIGYDQKEEVIELVKRSGKYKEVCCIKDLGGNDRVIKITY